MEKKKLQRVIGISVVVAFVIVLIPFLFGKKEMQQPETTAQISPEQQSTTTATDPNQVTAANTATDPNQPATVQDNMNAVNPADANNSSAQNTATTNADNNGITPIATPPVASSDQSAAPATVNPADTNNQAATPTQNVTGQSMSAISPSAANPANAANAASPAAAAVSAENTAPAENTIQAAPAVSTDTDDTTHPQATAEKTAAMAPAKEVKSKHVHKSLVAKKASHFSQQNIANLKKPAWVVQMGSFKDKSNAHRLVDQLRTSGYKAFTHVVTSPSGNVRTRVYIGPEFKQAHAQQLSTKIAREVKLQGYVVPFKPMAL